MSYSLSSDRQPLEIWNPIKCPSFVEKSLLCVWKPSSHINWTNWTHTKQNNFQDLPFPVLGFKVLVSKMFLTRFWLFFRDVLCCLLKLANEPNYLIQVTSFSISNVFHVTISQKSTQLSRRVNGRWLRFEIKVESWVSWADSWTERIARPFTQLCYWAVILWLWKI